MISNLRSNLNFILFLYAWCQKLSNILKWDLFLTIDMTICNHITLKIFVNIFFIGEKNLSFRVRLVMAVALNFLL